MRRGRRAWWHEPFWSLRALPSSWCPQPCGWLSHASSVWATSQPWVNSDASLVLTHRPSADASRMMAQSHPHWALLLLLPSSSLSAQNHSGSHVPESRDPWWPAVICLTFCPSALAHPTPPLPSPDPQAPTPLPLCPPRPSSPTQGLCSYGALCLEHLHPQTSLPPPPQPLTDPWLQQQHAPPLHMHLFGNLACPFAGCTWLLSLFGLKASRQQGICTDAVSASRTVLGNQEEGGREEERSHIDCFSRLLFGLL